MNTSSITTLIHEAIEKSIANRPFRPDSPLLNTAEIPPQLHRPHLYLDASPINHAVKALLNSREDSLKLHLDQLFSWRIECIIKAIDNALRIALRKLYAIELSSPCSDIGSVNDGNAGPFNLIVIEALVENQLLSPLYAMVYIAFYRDTKILTHLCNRYPESVVSLVSETEFATFHEDMHEVIADVIVSCPDGYSNLFAYLRAPISLTPPQYIFVVNTCLRIDQEMTLHHLSRITTFCQSDIKQVADCVFANTSPMRVIQNLPDCIRPFALKLMSKGL